MNTPINLFVKILLLGLLLLPGLGINSYAGELKAVTEDITTPPLKLNSLQDKAYDLSELKGKVVLVQFWATYCTPCRLEMPSMNKLMKKLQDEDVPFEILAVNMGESKEEVQKFVDEVKPEFTILLDKQGENVQAWNVFAAPSNFIIDTSGTIRYTLYGGVEWDSEEIIKTIRALAKEKESEKGKEKK